MAVATFILIVTTRSRTEKIWREAKRLNIASKLKASVGSVVCLLHVADDWYLFIGKVLQSDLVTGITV